VCLPVFGSTRLTNIYRVGTLENLCILQGNIPSREHIFEDPSCFFSYRFLSDSFPCVLASLGTSHKEAGAIKRLASYIRDVCHDRGCGVPHACSNLVAMSRTKPRCQHLTSFLTFIWSFLPPITLHRSLHISTQRQTP